MTSISSFFLWRFRKYKLSEFVSSKKKAKNTKINFFFFRKRKSFKEKKFACKGQNQ